MRFSDIAVVSSITHACAKWVDHKLENKQLKVTPAKAILNPNIELLANRAHCAGDTFDVNVCVVGVGVGNAKVKKPQVRIIYFADQNVTKDMIQYGVSKTITVKADIGAIELKKRLFDACVREWAKVNYGHVLVLEDLELVTANLVDILPPEDEEEPDETCMFLLLYTEDAKTGRIKFT